MKKSFAAFAALAVAGGLALVAAAPANAAEACTGITYDLERSDWVAGTPAEGYIEVDGDWDASVITLDWTGTIADLNDVLDIDATPIQYVGLHFRTAAGTLVFEEEPSYEGKLWSTTASSVPAGMGYASFGTIAEFAAAHGDIAVTSVDVLYTHPEESSTIVSSVTFGGEKITFDPATVDHYTDWYVVESGEGDALPDGRADGEEFQTDALYRYVVTGDVECAVVPPAKVTPTSSTLAKTGFDGGPMLITSSLGLLAAGGALALIAARRRAAAQK